MTTTASTPVAHSKTAALARVLDSVPKSYTFYTSGECPAGKVEALARKFHERYGIGGSPAQRLTRKQKGLANALLVIFWPPSRDTDLTARVEANPLPESASGSPFNPDTAPAGALETGLAIEREAAQSPSEALQTPIGSIKVSWLLLVTDGAGPVHEREHLRSVLDSPRLLWLGYELIRRASRGKVSWTWRRTKEEMTDLYALLAAQLNRRQKTGVAETLLRISRQPGFAGVREQSWALCQFARCRGHAGELPFLYFVQKLGHGVPLWLT